MSLRSGADSSFFRRAGPFSLRVDGWHVWMMHTARWGMAAALDQKQVDELLAKYRALAEKGQRRIDELEERNEHLVGEILSSLIVPTSAFGLSYARAYFGESASIFGIPIDAAAGMLLKGIATLLGFSSDNEVQVAAKVAHDVANGALASWSANAGTALGLKKRMEKPVPAPQPNTGAQEMPPAPLTHDDVSATAAATALNTQPAMPGPMPSTSMAQWPNVATMAHVAPTGNAPAAPPITPYTPRRSLDAARTVGLAEAVSAGWPQMPPQPNPMEMPPQFAQESGRSSQYSHEEAEAAAGWRLFIAEQARREQRSI